MEETENLNIYSIIGSNKAETSKKLNDMTKKEKESIILSTKQLDNKLSEELKSVLAVRRLDALPKKKIKYALISGLIISSINTLIFFGINILSSKCLFETSNIIGSIISQILASNIIMFTALNNNANYQNRKEIRRKLENCKNESDIAFKNACESYSALFLSLNKIKEELLCYKNNLNYLDENFVSCIDESIAVVQDRIIDTEQMKLELSKKYHN